MAADFAGAMALFIAVSIARYGSEWQEHRYLVAVAGREDRLAHGAGDVAPGGPLELPAREQPGKPEIGPESRQTARVVHEAKDPFQAAALHPAWRPPSATDEHVEAAAQAHVQRGPGAHQFGHQQLLARRAHANENDIGLCGGQVVLQGFDVRGFEVAVAVAGDD